MSQQRVCTVCHEPITPKAGKGGRPKKHCSNACKYKWYRMNRSPEQVEHNRRVTRQRRDRQKAARLQWRAFCTWCGYSFELVTAKTTCPNEECRNKRRSIVCSGVEGKRRAEAMGSEFEHFPLIEIANRDNYRCHVCGERVRVLGERGDDSMTFDHVQPIIDGGPHTRENLRTAHYRCNMQRGNRVEVEA